MAVEGYATATTFSLAAAAMPALHIQWGEVGQVQLPQGLLTLLAAVPTWVRECDSWAVLTIASVSLFWYARNFPPGPSFTYAWLWVGVLSTISRSTDANALFYLIGFGLITGWYTTQILQKDIWDRLLVYWLTMWPSWCVSTAVRFGDFVIHILPFAYSLQFYNHVALHHVFQAIVYERVYFFAIENSVIGTGQVANKIYALHPPCGPHVFRCIQMLSTVGYFFASTVCAGSGRQFLQALWLSLYVFIGFGTVGYFDSMAAKLPKDKDSLLTLLADWDEVNGKVTNYLQSLRDAVAQSLVSNLPVAPADAAAAPDVFSASSALALLFALPSTSTTTSSSCPSKAADLETVSQLLLSRQFPPRPSPAAKEEHTPNAPPHTNAGLAALRHPAHGSSKVHGDTGGSWAAGVLRAEEEFLPPPPPSLSSEEAGDAARGASSRARALPPKDASQHMQSLVDQIRNLEDVVNKLKSSCATQHQELRCSGDRISSPGAVVSLHANKQRAPARQLPAVRKNSRRAAKPVRPVYEHPSECSTRPSSQNTQRPRSSVLAPADQPASDLDLLSLNLPASLRRRSLRTFGRRAEHRDGTRWT